MWNLFNVMVFHAPMVIWGGVNLPSVFMCILWYVKLIWCNGLACTYGQLTGGSICLWYICALSHVWNLCGVMILHAAMVDCLGAICLWYICAFSYMWKVLSVMVLYRYMVNWRRGGVNLPLVYVHCAIYETYLV